MEELPLLRYLIPGLLERRLRDNLLDDLESNSFEELIEEGVDVILNWESIDDPEAKRIYQALTIIHPRAELRNIVENHIIDIVGKETIAGLSNRDENDNLIEGSQIFDNPRERAVAGSVGVGFGIGVGLLIYDFIRDPDGWKCGIGDPYN